MELDREAVERLVGGVMWVSVWRAIVGTFDLLWKWISKIS